MRCKGYKLTLDKNGCEIKKGRKGRLVAKSIRTDKNIYYLKEAKGGNCLIAHSNKCWLLHKWMGHIDFDNMVKISSTQVVWDMPKIINPTNTLWKENKMGKQTKTRFKRKEYSSPKSLELIHTYLFKPTRTRGLNCETYTLWYLHWLLL